MRLFRFTFKNEALWMMILSFAPGIIALLIVLIVFLARR
jgi:hypothetical protein